MQDVSGQVIINEFQALNTSFIQDPDFQDFPDWIELFNGNDSVIDISGYFLTDNLLVSNKWEIPADTKIQAGAYLVIWADGENVNEELVTRNLAQRASY